MGLNLDRSNFHNIVTAYTTSAMNMGYNTPPTSINELILDNNSILDCNLFYESNTISGYGAYRGIISDYNFNSLRGYNEITDDFVVYVPSYGNLHEIVNKINELNSNVLNFTTEEFKYLYSVDFDPMARVDEFGKRTHGVAYFSNFVGEIPKNYIICDSPQIFNNNEDGSYSNTNQRNNITSGIKPAYQFKYPYVKFRDSGTYSSSYYYNFCPLSDIDYSTGIISGSWDDEPYKDNSDGNWYSFRGRCLECVSLVAAIRGVIPLKYKIFAWSTESPEDYETRINETYTDSWGNIKYRYPSQNSRIPLNAIIYVAFDKNDLYNYLNSFGMTITYSYEEASSKNTDDFDRPNPEGGNISNPEFTGDGYPEPRDLVYADVTNTPRVASGASTYILKSPDMPIILKNLWNSNFFKNIILNQNPYDYIVSLRWYPCNLVYALQDNPELFQNERTVFIGDVDVSNVLLQYQRPCITNGSYKPTLAKAGDLWMTADDTQNTKWGTGSYLDYEPYCTYSLYIPFQGHIPLVAKEILNKYLELYYSIDVISGEMMTVLKADGQEIVNSICQIGYECNFHGVDRISETMNRIGSYYNIAKPIVDMIPMTKGRKKKKSKGKISLEKENQPTQAQQEEDALDLFPDIKSPSIDNSCPPPQIYNSLNLPAEAYIRVQVNEITSPEKFYDNVGRSSNYRTTLNKLDGYIEVADIRFNITTESITENEMDIMRGLLERGVFING